MIPLLGAVTVTRQRFGAITSYSADGTPVLPTPVETQILASIQGMSMSTRLPEAIRADATATAITYSEVLPDRGSVPADRLVDGDRVYAVLHVRPMPAFLGQPVHYECALAEIGTHQRGG